ncbi:hypothetical protein OG445_46590 (plasmid) [Streptomyces sp. NBC_01462]|nr:hypothetical protein [Streptomyces sp. NBC_01462]
MNDAEPRVAAAKAKLDLSDRVLLTVLQQNLALPPTVSAHLSPSAVSKDTIRHTSSEIRRLMDQHAHAPRPPTAHLNTLAGPLVHATPHDPHDRDQTSMLILYGA